MAKGYLHDSEIEKLQIRIKRLEERELRFKKCQERIQSYDEDIRRKESKS